MPISQDAIYWITRLDELKCLLSAVSAFAILFLILAGAIALFIRYDCSSWKDAIEEYPFVRIARILFIACALIAPVSIITNTLVPTTRQMVLMKVIPALQTPECQALVKSIIDNNFKISSTSDLTTTEATP